MTKTPMQREAFYIFAGEIAYHCDGMLEYHRIFRDFSGVGQRPPLQSRDPFQYLRHSKMERYMVENITTHAAGISRIFFPIDKSRKSLERAELLRTWFEIEEDNIFLKRSVRDALQHTDERLHKYLERLSEHVLNDQLKSAPLPSLESKFGISEDGFCAEWFEAAIKMEEGAALMTEATRLKDKAAMHIPVLKNRTF